MIMVLSWKLSEVMGGIDASCPRANCLKSESIVAEDKCSIGKSLSSSDCCVWFSILRLNHDRGAFICSWRVRKTRKSAERAAKPADSVDQRTEMAKYRWDDLHSANIHRIRRHEVN